MGKRRAGSRQRWPNLSRSRLHKNVKFLGKTCSHIIRGHFRHRISLGQLVIFGFLHFCIEFRRLLCQSKTLGTCAARQHKREVAPEERATERVHAIASASRPNPVQRALCGTLRGPQRDEFDFSSLLFTTIFFMPSGADFFLVSSISSSADVRVHYGTAVNVRR